tara:strand:+ start:781 stop:1665 length:885 start_codon:yes stop_codon:yes gene_type:complete
MRYINYGRTPDQQNLVTKGTNQNISVQNVVTSTPSKGIVQSSQTATVNLKDALNTNFEAIKQQITFGDPYATACVANIAYKPANKEMAQDFLKRELDRIDNVYQESMEQLEAATFIISLWNNVVVGIAAPIVSLVATPLAAGLVVSIGGIIGQTASFVVDKLRDGIELGIVSPDFLDYVAMINKDTAYYVQYTEELSKKSSNERFTMAQVLVQNYEALKQMANLPYPMGSLMQNTAAYQGTLARIEIMLSVLCDLNQQDSQGGGNGNGNGNDEGSGKGLVIAAIAALVGGALLL